MILHIWAVFLELRCQHVKHVMRCKDKHLFWWTVWHAHWSSAMLAFDIPDDPSLPLGYYQITPSTPIGSLLDLFRQYHSHWLGSRTDQYKKTNDKTRYISLGLTNRPPCLYSGMATCRGCVVIPCSEILRRMIPRQLIVSAILFFVDNILNKLALFSTVMTMFWTRLPLIIDHVYRLIGRHVIIVQW